MRANYVTVATAFALIAAAMRGDLGAKLSLDGMKVQHRGKGRGTPSRRFGNSATNWTGRRSGLREAARRKRQMERGLLREHPRAVVLAQHRAGA